jgi:hypothetical protein
MALTSDQMEQLRRAVMERWDPIGVFHDQDDAEDRAAYWDEYDSYLPNIADHLRRGDVDGLTAYLARLRTVDMGMSAEQQLDRNAAQALIDWSSDSLFGRA